MEQKKYDDIIDFPVEIVGRDGVVRHYSFEDSVSLYQRRIRLARLRFEDKRARDKELLHCSKRIEQLRRSYFTRYGWEAFQFDNTPKNLTIEISGEISAYLRRRFGCGDIRNTAILNSLDENEGFWIFGLQIDAWQGMLYCVTSALDMQKLLLQMSDVPQTDVEFVIDAFHGTDLWMVVTGFGESLQPIEALSEEEEPAIAMVYQAIADGQLVEALALLIHLCEKEPYNKQVYWTGLVLAEQLRVHEQGLLIANMALSYFPGHFEFVLRKVANCMRLGRWKEADETYRTVQEQLPKDSPMVAGWVEVLFMLNRKEFRKALEVIQQQKEMAKRSLKQSTKGIRMSQQWLIRQLVLMKTMTYLGWIGMLVSFGFGIWLHAVFLTLIPVFIFGIWMLNYWFQTTLQKALLGTRYFQFTILANNDIYAMNKTFSDVH